MVKVKQITNIIMGKNFAKPNIWIFTFNIIITNRNNTAIAPTYIIISNKPKKSAPNIKQMAEAFKKVRTKNRIEWTEFSDKNRNKAERIKKQFKKIWKIVSIKWFGVVWFEHTTFYSQNRHATTTPHPVNKQDLTK